MTLTTTRKPTDAPVRPTDETVETEAVARDQDDEEDEVEEAPAKAADEFGPGADDALGLYLRQMGAIRLLNKDQEHTLAKRLDVRRARFRRAALTAAHVIGRARQQFERVAAGQTALDPTIDVYSDPRMALARQQIIDRMKPHLETVKNLLLKEAREFADRPGPTASAASPRCGS
jgi:RNA polymerase primary sigma factor